MKECVQAEMMLPLGQLWFYKITRTSSSWLASGKLERKGQVIHVVVNKIEDLSAVIGDWQVRSRDFH